MAESDPEKLILKAGKLTTLGFTRWKADWSKATPMYEQAALGFRNANSHEKAKLAFEKASQGQEMLSSPWDAAKHMESAAALAKNIGNWREVADFYRKASELYNECGRSQPASDALARGARCRSKERTRPVSFYMEHMKQGCFALEETLPDEAIQLYTDACTILEEDGKEQMAFDLYRAVTSIYIKLRKYDDAASFLLRLGLAADKSNARHSQCKAYLGAMVVYLFAHDLKQAEKCFNDCSQTDAFMGSDQYSCASKLFAAYSEGDAEEIKRISQSSTISHLDTMVIRLARQLPTGDLSSLKTSAAEEDEEPLDENDLT